MSSTAAEAASIWASMPITADDLFQATGVAEEEQEVGQSIPEEELKERKTTRLSDISKLIGVMQVKPREDQDRIFSEVAAKYLPRLAESFRRQTTANSAAECLMNYLAYTLYFVRFTQTPQAAGLCQHMGHLLVAGQLLPTSDLHTTIAELHQFFSTLLVFSSAYPSTPSAPLPSSSAASSVAISPEDKAPLLQKMKAYRNQYRGRFAAETTERCIDILEGSPEMTVMLPGVRMTLSKGLETCSLRGCSVWRDSEKEKGRDLLQCSRCKTYRYCGTDHQRQDWPTHKKKCFSPVF